MKKVLAVILSALMILCVLPVFSFAADPVRYTESEEFEEETQFNINGTTVIATGATMTVPAGMNMTIAAGNKVTVEEGATLNVLGTVKVAKGAELDILGSVAHSERVTVLGTANVHIVFPNIGATGLGAHMESIYAGYSNDGSSYADVSNNVTWSANLVNGGTFLAPLNSYVFVKTAFVQPFIAGYEETPVSYDNAKVKVFFNGVAVPFKQGVHTKAVSDAVAVTFMDGNGSLSALDWNEAAYLYDYSFNVPSGSGYTVSGRHGETCADGAIKLPAGSSFDFRIEIDKDYDMSLYEVYSYKGYIHDDATLKDKIDAGEATLMVADDDGYYTISDIYSDYTIAVTGVVSNAAINKASSILDLIRNVFNIFKEIFAKIAAFFGM